MTIKSVNITKLSLLEKTKCKICIAWNGTQSENIPKWLSDLWVDKNRMWIETKISFAEIIELYNCGIDVMLSHNSEGEILIGLNKMGWRFSMR